MNPKYLMDTFGLEPKKSLGQNFLHDPNVLEKIVSTAELEASDTVLEIGPGTGALTVHLAQSGAKVVAVEIDDRLIPILERQLGDFPNVQVVHGNILEIQPEALVGDDDYVVVANLPYYITSAILQHLLEASHKPKRLVLTVQQEVAERLVSQPGDMSVLAISVQFYGKPQIASRLNPAVFWPRPDVSSAVVRIDTYAEPPVDVPDAALFFKVVKAGFGQKRKQLKNSLAAGMGLSHAETGVILEVAGVDPTRRAETLSLEEWAAITRVIACNPAEIKARLEESATSSQSIATVTLPARNFNKMHKVQKVGKYAQGRLVKIGKRSL